MVNHRPHKKQKIRPPLQQPRYGPIDLPNPSIGGNGYPESTRRIADELYNDVGRVTYLQLRNTTIPNLPHPVTVERYQQCINTTGSNIHMRHTGNRRSGGIRGFPLLLLTFYRRAYPKASRYEIIAFLWRSYSSILPTPRIYSLNDITNAHFPYRQLAVSSLRPHSPRSIISTLAMSLLPVGYLVVQYRNLFAIFLG